jgi:carbamoyltransferase
MNILGISCFYHDSAACLLQHGNIIAAAQEERFSRKKHDPRFPHNALKYCLDEAGIGIDNIDYLVFYDKPFLTFERLLMSYLTVAPKGLRSWLESMPLWLGKKLYIPKVIKQEIGYEKDVLYTEHHEAHAASAFYPSPFKEAAILTIDGVGEWATASYGYGKGRDICLLKELHFPDSLGLLYSAFTYFTGFRVNSGEYKLMGLAPYGVPKYKDLIYSELVDVKDDGSIRLNMSYFDFLGGLRMTNRKCAKLFRGPPRQPETTITQREMDIAASVQSVTEDIMIKMAAHVYKETKLKNLCLAGGVALNCVSNGRILREGPFENIWIQPAAGDAGGALGAALSVWHRYLGKERLNPKEKDRQRGSYLGPSFKNDYIKNYLEKKQIANTQVSDEEIPEKIADLIAEQKVIGWFQGRMEFGPRALGNRSILGDARSQKMQEIMNLKIKFRESFRPFAPSVIKDKASSYFEIDRESPYMLLVAPVKEEIRREPSDEEKKLCGFDRLHIVRSSIPAVTHLDYSARLQTVDGNHNSLFHQMIKKFDEKYGCPVIINTSFNVRGEPIVCTPQDAYLCFMRTNMDYLIMGNFLIEKKDQKPLEKDLDWTKEFELD